MFSHIVKSTPAPFTSTLPGMLIMNIAIPVATAVILQFALPVIEKVTKAITEKEEEAKEE